MESSSDDATVGLVADQQQPVAAASPAATAAAAALPNSVKQGSCYPQQSNPCTDSQNAASAAATQTPDAGCASRDVSEQASSKKLRVFGFSLRSGIVSMTDKNETVRSTAETTKTTSDAASTRRDVSASLSPIGLSVFRPPQNVIPAPDAVGQVRKAATVAEKPRTVEYHLKPRVGTSATETSIAIADVGPTLTISSASSFGISLPVAIRNKYRKGSKCHTAGSGFRKELTAAHHDFASPQSAATTDFQRRQQHMSAISSVVPGLPHIESWLSSPGLCNHKHSPTVTSRVDRATSNGEPLPMAVAARRALRRFGVQHRARPRDGASADESVYSKQPSSCAHQQQQQQQTHHQHDRPHQHRQSFIITPPGIPSPFLLQTGLEKALDFAEFQPMSPSSASSTSPPPHHSGAVGGNVDGGTDVRGHNADYSCKSGRRAVTSTAETGSGLSLASASGDAIRSVATTRAIENDDLISEMRSTASRSDCCDSMSTRCRLQVGKSESVYGMPESPTVCSVLPGGEDIQAEGCYWDGLQCEEEQIDQWQTTVWSGGVGLEFDSNAAGESRSMTEARSEIDASSFSLVGVRLKAAATTSTSPTSVGASEKRKRRPTSCDKRNTGEGGAGDGKHKRATGVASTEAKKHGTGRSSRNTVQKIATVVDVQNGADATHCAAATCDGGGKQQLVNVADGSSTTLATVPSTKSRHRNRKEPSGECRVRHRRHRATSSVSANPRPAATELGESDGASSHDPALVKLEKLSPTKSAPSCGDAREAAETSSSSQTPNARRSSSERHRRHKSNRLPSEDRASEVSKSTAEARAAASSKPGQAVANCADGAACGGTSNDGAKIKRRRSSSSSSSNVRSKHASASSTSVRQTSRTKSTQRKKRGGSSSRSSECHRCCSFLVDPSCGSCGARDDDGNDQLNVGDMFQRLLVEWERYVTLGNEDMHGYEVENARHFRYNDDAMATIANRDLEVWRLVEQM
jgi:hypothetical protein